MRYAADPIEGFFAGLTSGVGRIFFSFVAVAWGAAVCFMALGHLDNWAPLYLWIFLWIGMLFGWASFGVFWFFVGLSAFITMVIGMWYFTQEHRPKRSFFVTFAAATLYYSPVCFREYLWVYIVIIFSVCAGGYWFLPMAQAWFDQWKFPAKK